MGRKLWKSSFKFIEGQAVEFRPHLNFLLFLDFGVVLHEIPMSSKLLGISLAQMMLVSRPGLF